MTRSIAGTFDPDARADRSRLVGALEPHQARVVERGPLAVAFSGSPASSTGPLCLIAGHVDNARALGVELNAPPERSTEEVLAAGYLRWSLGLLARLRGEFSLLLWDRERREGLLARDQLGVGSLYVHDVGGALCFATEICHLLALLRRRPAPDAAGVAHWVAARSRPGAGTLYEGVRRLAPGDVLTLEEGRVRERRYWSPRFSEPVELAEPDRTRCVRDAIARAVGRRLGRFGDTGVLMSGGLDSASVAGVAAQLAPGRVGAFSAVFPGRPAVDESELISQLRVALGLPGVTAEVGTGGLVASALESQRAWQLPLLSWGDFWTLPLMRAAAASGVEVMLGGDGGDELFATRVYLLADRLRGGAPRQALRLARELPGAGENPPARALLAAARSFAFAGALPYGPHERLRSLAPRRVPPWLRRRAVRELTRSEDPLAWKRLEGPRWWAHAAYGLTRGIEQAGIFELHRHRAALAGLQARHPLLDLDLVELLLRQPPRDSFDRHRNRPTLRACMAGTLPEAVRMRRRKALFDPLIVDTLRGPDGAGVRRLLCDPRAELGAYVDLAGMRRSLLERRSGAPGHDFQWMQHVWRLTTAECWLRAQTDPSSDRLAAVVDASPARVTLRHEHAHPRRGKVPARVPRVSAGASPAVRAGSHA